MLKTNQTTLARLWRRLKDRANEIAGPFGNALLALALVGSLLPVAGLAYAAEELLGLGPAEARATAEGEASDQGLTIASAEDVASEGEPATTDGPVDDGRDANEDVVASAGADTPLVPASDDTATVSNVRASFAYPSDLREVDGTLYADGAVTATIRVTADGLDDVAAASVAATVTVSGQAATTLSWADGAFVGEVTYPAVADEVATYATVVSVTTTDEEAVVVEGEPTSDAKPVVVDQVAPTVEATLVYGDDDGDHAVLSDEASGTGRLVYLDLPDDADTVTLRLTIADASLDAAASSVSLAWLDDANANPVGEGVAEPAGLTRNADGTYTSSFAPTADGVYEATIGPLAAKDFFVGFGDAATLVRARASVSAKDYAGNEAGAFSYASHEDVTALELCSDSEALARLPHELTVASSAASATRGDGVTIYRGDVDVTLVDRASADADAAYLGHLDLAKTGVLVNDELSPVGDAYRDADPRQSVVALTGDGSYEVAYRLATAHGATRVGATDAADALSLAIDTTTPAASVALGAATGTHDGTSYYNEIAPTITVTNATTLAGDPSVTLCEGADETGESVAVAWGEVDANGTLVGTIANEDIAALRPGETSSCTLRLSGSSLFEGDADLVATSDPFVYDARRPVVGLTFSGPVVAPRLTADEGIDHQGTSAFFARFMAWDKANHADSPDDYEDGAIGSLTVRVSDANLDAGKTMLAVTDATGAILRTYGLSGETTEIPYYAEGGALCIGEVTGGSVTVSAFDYAGNRTSYAYAQKDDETDSSTTVSYRDGGEEREVFGPSLSDALTIDVTPVRFEGWAVVDEAIVSRDVTQGDARIRAFRGDTVTVRLTVADANLDRDASVVTVDRYDYDVKTGSIDLSAPSETTPLSGDGWIARGEGSTTYDLDVTLEAADALYAISLSANDTLGNTTTTAVVGSDDFDYLCVDDAAPQASFAMDQQLLGSSDDVDYYGADLRPTVRVFDPNFDPEATTITLSTTKADPIVVGSGASAFSLVIAPGRDGWKLAEGEGNVALWEYVLGTRSNEEVLVENGLGGSYQLSVHGTDTLGNEGSSPYGGEDARSIVVDRSDPVVTVQVESVYGAYNVEYQADVYPKPAVGEVLEVTVTVVDNSFDTSSEITRNVDAGGDVGVWMPSRTQPGTWTKTITYGEGNVHELSLAAADLAGHVTNYAYGDNPTSGGVEETSNATWAYEGDGTTKRRVYGPHFAFDASAPRVDLTVGQAVANKETYGSDARGNDYFAQRATVTLGVTDANFDPEGVEIYVYETSRLSKETKGEPTKIVPTASDWLADETTPNRHVYVGDGLDFVESGVGGAYTIDVIAEDLSVDVLGSSGLVPSSTDEAHTTGYRYGGTNGESPLTPVSQGWGNQDSKTLDVQGAELDGPAFVIDATAPSIDVAMGATPAGTLEGVDYYDEDSVTATVTVVDRSLVASEDDRTRGADQVVVTGTNARNVAVANDDPATSETWTSAAIAFGQSAVSTTEAIALTARDYAGHETTYQAQSSGFVVDAHAPKVKVTIADADDEAEAPDGPYAYGTPQADYYASQLVATLDAWDNNFDPDAEVSVVTTTGEVTQAWKQDEEDATHWTAKVAFDDTAVDAAESLELVARDKVYAAIMANEAREDKGAADAHATSWRYADGERSYGANSWQDAATGSETFVVDTVAPSVTVDFTSRPKVEAAVPTSGDDTMLTDYYDERQTATIAVTDAHFDPSDVNAVDLEVLGAYVMGSWVQDESDHAVWRIEVRFDDNGPNLSRPGSPSAANSSALSLTARDRVGLAARGRSVAGSHTSSWDYETGMRLVKGSEVAASGAAYFVVDTVAPTVAVTIDQPLAGTLDGVDYYASTTGGVLTARVVVTDNNFDPDTTGERALQQAVDMGWASVDGSWSQEDDATWYATAVYVDSAADAPHRLAFAVADRAAHTTDYVYGGTAAGTSTKDAAGATVGGEGHSNTFVLDTVVPRIAVAFSEAPVGFAGSPQVDYYDANVTATVTVVDRNFDPSSESATELTQRGGTIAQEWTQIGGKGGDTWQTVVSFTENRVGANVDVVDSVLGVVAVDKAHTAAVRSGGTIAGHDARWIYAGGDVGQDRHGSAAAVFVIDLTAPTVSVNVSEIPQNRVDGTDYYGTATNGALVATVTVVDDNFDVTSEIRPTNGSVASGWTTSDGRTYTAQVRFGESVGAQPSDLVLPDVRDLVQTAANAAGTTPRSAHATSYDYGGVNTTVKGVPTSLGANFVVDLTAPSIELVRASTTYANAYATGLTGRQEGSAYSEPYLFYNASGTPGVSVRMFDDNKLSSASIVAPFTFDGTSSLANVNSRSLTRFVALIEGTGMASRNELTRNIVVRLTDYANNWRTWSVSPTGVVRPLNAGSEAASANTFVDELSQRTTHPQALVLDRTAPGLSWSTSVTPGAYYNTTQAVTLDVSELNFDYLRTYDAGQTVVTVSEYAGNAGRALTTWTRSVRDFSGGGQSYATSMTFDRDGHYVLHADLTDPATNRSTLDFQEFTIDKTPPVIDSITYDNNDVRNGRYYKAARTATITVTEHNWDEGRSVITSNGSIGSWYTSGDTHVATVTFSTDGDYNLSVSVTDRAGNSAQRSEPEFTIDLTAPTIEFADVEDSTAYGDVIAPSIIFADERNFDPAGTSWTLTGAKHGERSFATSTTSQANGATVTYADFDHEVEVDDIYTLEAHLVDLAGNEAEGSVAFSVNRFGSNFVVVDPEQYEDGYLSAAPEVLIREINVSGAASENHGVSVTHGLTTTDLEQVESRGDGGRGFYIQSGNDGAGWSTYTYHVKRGNFLSDDATDEESIEESNGNYHVVVNSLDAADNLNNSASYYDPETHEVASAEVSFILDTVSPIISGLNVRDGGMYNSPNYEVQFSLTDNIGVKEVSVTLDGKPVASDAITSDADGLYTFSIPAQSFSPHDVQIGASDFAENVLASDDDPTSDRRTAATGFRVTTNFVELYLPWMVGAVVLTASGIVVATRVRAGRREEE